MSRSKELMKCSFLMLYGCWCDIFNISAGAMVCVSGGPFSLIGASIIMIHLASLFYMVLHQKLGFQYHEKTSRLLMIYPQLCHLVFACYCYLSINKTRPITLELSIMGKD